MKRPVLYLPALADQEILMRSLYALKLGCEFANFTNADNGWNCWAAHYVSNGKPIYPYVYVNNRQIAGTIFSEVSWQTNNLAPAYIKVNSIAQFLAYVKTNYAVPSAAPAPTAPFAATHLSSLSAVDSMIKTMSVEDEELLAAFDDSP